MNGLKKGRPRFQVHPMVLNLSLRPTCRDKLTSLNVTCRPHELRGPRAPAFTHEALLRLVDKRLPWVWQRDVVRALMRFIMTDSVKAVCAGSTLAEDFWWMLYRSVDSPTG